MDRMRSFSLPEFDPFWARIQAERVVVTMHESDSGYSRQANEGEGQREFRPFAASDFRMYWNSAHSPIADGFAALACHGTLARFPQLRIVSVENGRSGRRP